MLRITSFPLVVAIAAASSLAALKSLHPPDTVEQMNTVLASDTANCNQIYAEDDIVDFGLIRLDENGHPFSPHGDWVMPSVYANWYQPAIIVTRGPEQEVGIMYTSSDSCKGGHMRKANLYTRSDMHRNYYDGVSRVTAGAVSAGIRDGTVGYSTAARPCYSSHVQPIAS